MNRFLPLLLATSSLPLASCASTSARKSGGELDRMVHDRAGASPLAGENDDSIQKATLELLSGPLSPDAAVRIALLNNPGFRGRLSELGVAQAELAQAAVIENPKLHASWRYPRGGGQTGRELGVDMNFLDRVAADHEPIYACPMHPGVTADKPGTCPKCGMQLERKEGSHDEKH